MRHLWFWEGGGQSLYGKPVAAVACARRATKGVTHLAETLNPADELLTGRRIVQAWRASPTPSGVPVNTTVAGQQGHHR